MPSTKKKSSAAFGIYSLDAIINRKRDSDGRREALKLKRDLVFCSGYADVRDDILKKRKEAKSDVDKQKLEELVKREQEIKRELIKSLCAGVNQTLRSGQSLFTVSHATQMLDEDIKNKRNYKGKKVRKMNGTTKKAIGLSQRSAASGARSPARSVYASSIRSQSRSPSVSRSSQRIPLSNASNRAGSSAQHGPMAQLLISQATTSGRKLKKGDAIKFLDEDSGRELQGTISNVGKDQCVVVYVDSNEEVQVCQMETSKLSLCD